MTTVPAILTAAHALVAAGISVIPIKEDGSKAPAIGTWKEFQSRHPGTKELERWLTTSGKGLAIVNGAVSGNLETFDADAPELFDQWVAQVEHDAPGLLARIPMAATPTGGRHLYYHCATPPPGNMKLALRPPTPDEQAAAPGLLAVVLFETRGEGGYAIVPPSPAACHPSRKPYVLLHLTIEDAPIITADERDVLLSNAQVFNTYVPAQQVIHGTRTSTKHNDGDRPGDIFNRDADWSEILQGWRSMGTRGEVELWQRPGKEGRGLSATTNYGGSGLLYVFSSSAAPFEPLHAYSPFAAYALLAHNGDYSAAAKELRGRQMTAPPAQKPRVNLTGKAAAASDTAPDAPGSSVRQTVSERLRAAMQQLGYAFRLNRANDTIECNGALMDDILLKQLRMHMRDLDVRPLAALDDFVVAEAALNSFHPVHDYLNALVWDGEQHISRLAAHLTSSDPHVVYGNGSTRPLHHVYLFRWLIGACAKALAGEQNMMLVLAGPQNIGKSRMASWLCSGIPETFIEAAITAGERDTEVRLMKHFVWEVAELDATTRRTDVAALKAFITKKTVMARKAYDHHDTVKPALASFIGTINPSTGFLGDETGSRRFWITTLTKIDWAYTQMDVDQVWAEALHYYRTTSEQPWTLTADETGVRDTQNREHEMETILEGWIEKYLELHCGDHNRMTAAEIVDLLRAKDIKLSGTERSQAMEISRVLAHLGIQRARGKDAQGRTWRGYEGLMPR